MYRLFRLAVVVFLAGIFAAPRTPSVIRRYTLNTTGAARIGRLGTPTFHCDFTQDPSGSTITSNSGHVLTKVGAPERHGDFTYPDGFSGSATYHHWFDGANDFWEKADDGTFDPAGDATWHIVIVPELNTGADDIWSKWYNNSDQGWVMAIDNGGADIHFYISSDGTDSSSVILNNVVNIYEPLAITFSYNYVTDGTSEMRIWANEHTVAETTNAAGPIHNTDNKMTFCGRDAGGAGNPCQFQIQQAIFWDGTAATESDHLALWRTWQGRYDWAVASTTPPSIQVVDEPDAGTGPVMMDSTTNSFYLGTTADGKGGLYSAAAISNLAQRSSLEACAGSPTTPTGWTATRTDGTGTVTGVCDTTYDAHKNVSFVGTKTSAGNGTVILTSSFCVDINPSNDYYLDAWFYGSSDDEDMNLGLKRYSDNACSTYVDTVYTATDQDVPQQWTRYGGEYDSAAWATTESVEIEIVLVDTTGDGNTYVDAIQFRQASTATDAGCYANTDATASCNSVDATIDAGFIPTGTWQINFVARTPFDWSDANNHYFFYVPKTGGTNNNRIEAYFNADVAYLNVYTDDSTLKTASVACDIAANTDVWMTFRKSATGHIQACCDSTCGTLTSGVTNDGMGSDFTIDGTNGGDIWIRELVFRRRMAYVYSEP